MVKALVVLAIGVAVAAPAPDDWQRLWVSNGKTPPAPVAVRVGDMGPLGEELSHFDWLMVETARHQIYYQPATDPKLVAGLFSLIDNLYEFLSGRSPDGPFRPVRTFLVPGERGHSRCWPEGNAMRTGAAADLPFVLASLLHEETHLFNTAFLQGKEQGWWTGEFACQYFQERALAAAQRSDLRARIAAKLPKGPAAPLADLDRLGKEGFQEALAAQYFLEETFGRDLFNRFRRECLKASAASNGGRLPAKVFQQVFGKTEGELDRAWRTYFWSGLPLPPVPPPPAESRPILPARAPAPKPAGPPVVVVPVIPTVATGPEEPMEGEASGPTTPVTYSAEKISVQSAAEAVAKLAGLRYNWEKSVEQTAPTCRNYLYSVSIDHQPFREALAHLLQAVGLRFEIEDGAVVLYRR